MRIGRIILVSIDLILQACNNESPDGPARWIEVQGDGIHLPAVYHNFIITDYNGVFVLGQFPYLFY